MCFRLWTWRDKAGRNDKATPNCLRKTTVTKAPTDDHHHLIRNCSAKKEKEIDELLCKQNTFACTYIHRKNS